jgi:hypothetical protein
LSQRDAFPANPAHWPVNGALFGRILASCAPRFTALLTLALILKRDMRSHHDKLKARRVRGMERLGHRHLLDLADARVLR